MRLFQDSKRELYLAHRHELQGQSKDVLHYLETVSAWDNGVPPAYQVALDLGLLREAVSRCYTQLVKAQFLIKHNGRYFLTPLLVWKGTEKQFQAACKVLLYEQPVLPEPRQLAEPRASYRRR